MPLTENELWNSTCSIQMTDAALQPGQGVRPNLPVADTARKLKRGMGIARPHARVGTGGHMEQWLFLRVTAQDGTGWRLGLCHLRRRFRPLGRTTGRHGDYEST